VRRAPCFYFNLVPAVAVGFVWFGETPTAMTPCGLSFIAFGGLISLLSPARVKKLLSNKIKGLGRDGANSRRNFANA
jgi:drug/metabolite transporter (DMT)-like permease